MSESRRRSSRRVAQGITRCPACGGAVKSDAKWCPNCRFTGADSAVIFPDPPPPLLPILDAVGLLRDADLREIEVARDSLRRRFPQFHWRICTVSLPEGTALPVFGFWLLNVCPLDGPETAEERASTFLLLVDVASGQAAVIPGYAVEPYLSDDDWKTILTDMTAPWQAGNPAAAFVAFFKASRRHLDAAWKRYGAPVSSRKHSP